MFSEQHVNAVHAPFLLLREARIDFESVSQAVTEHV